MQKCEKYLWIITFLVEYFFSNFLIMHSISMKQTINISSVCQRCYYQLRQIRRVRKSLSAASKLLLVLASVHSRLDYCNSVLHSLPWSRLQLLQSVLNSAARLIRGLGRFDHITPVLITCTGYRTPSVFLTRSVCLCSSV